MALKRVDAVDDGDGDDDGRGARRGAASPRAGSGETVLRVLMLAYALFALVLLVVCVRVRWRKGGTTGGLRTGAGLQASVAVGLQGSVSEGLQASVSEDLQRTAALDSFSVEKIAERKAGTANNVERRREIQSDLLGPLTPVNCGRVQTYCLVAKNCTIFCKDASVTEFDCVKGVCVERPLDHTKLPESSANAENNCDTKNGEYGLLVGYNDLGIAQWQCVQLYPGWQQRNRYCEGGRVELDVRLREPSFRDCLCPEGTKRMVYKRSVLGQVAYGLPHCVPDRLVKFYQEGYQEM